MLSGRNIQQIRRLRNAGGGFLRLQNLHSRSKSGRRLPVVVMGFAQEVFRYPEPIATVARDDALRDGRAAPTLG